MRLRVGVPPHVAVVIRHLPAEVKRAVKAAGADLAVGEPLRREIEGLWKFRVRCYRLVDTIDRRQRVIRLYAVGHRRAVSHA